MLASEIKNKLVENNLIGDDKINEVVNNLSNLSNNNFLLLGAKQIQICLKI